MDKDQLQQFKNKLTRGVFALASRTFILQVISFGATFILTILLSPSAFGVFFVVSAVISFLTYFSDVGFAAALIQKAEEPSQNDLSTAFTVQQILVGTLIVLALLLTNTVARFYQLESGGIWLFQALLISFFLSSLKTIPSILIERKLEFILLVVPQILETLVFYSLAIILAVRGLGISSFAWAAVARGIVGLIAIYIISPWQIRLGISKSSLRSLLSYGIPFQANSILALLKDDLMTIFLGKILPFSYVGYIGWGKKWAEAPLRLIMDNIIRVTFPAFSRIQKDKETLKKALEKSFFFLGLFIFPITALLVLYIRPLIDFFPKYTKWEPALLSFYLFSVSAVFAAFSSPSVNALNAIGKIKSTLKLMIFWTFLTWVTVPFFSFQFGLNGPAIAAVVIGVTAIIPIYMVKKIISFRVFQPITKPLLATVILILPSLFFIQYATNIILFFTFLSLSIAIYTGVSWVTMRNEILPYLPKIIKSR